MSELIVTAFKDPHEAEEVRTKLLRLQTEHLVELEDAAIVVRKEDGSLKLKQTHNLPLAGAASGSLWGLLIGLLFAAPLVGLAVGAGAGAVTGALSDIGIDDQFMRELGKSIPPGSSALFILVRKMTTDKVIRELAPFTGSVLKTSLPYDDERKLLEALEAARKKANLAA